MDAQNIVGEWSVEKVLQIIIVNCRSWRGEGMKVRADAHITVSNIWNACIIILIDKKFGLTDVYANALYL